MSHELESGFFGGRQPAWHGLGTVIDADVVTAAEALTLSGADWIVERREIYYKMDAEMDNFGATYEPEVQVDTHVANTRSDTNVCIGIVGEGYVPFQNVELADLATAIVDSGDAMFHTGGVLRHGRRVWFLVKLSADILIGGEPSEKIENYLLVSNGHDGSMAVTAAVTPVRVVCANTLGWALEGSQRVWKARHTTSVAQRMQEARRALELSFKYTGEFEKLADAMILRKMGVDEFDRFLKDFIPIEDGVEGRALTIRTNKREALRNVWTNSPNLENVRGTAWGVYNAVAEWNDHFKSDGTGSARDKGERAFERAITSIDKDRAFAMLKG